MSLMVGISGIRGIVGESLTPEVVVRYAAAFGEYCRRIDPAHPSVVLGRDGRITGKTITHIISSTLLSMGVQVRAIGICPTPTVQLAVEKGGATGGISVTASHNPMPWNGMKFVAPTGMFLNFEENELLFTISRSTPSYRPWNDLGQHTAEETWLRSHIDAVLALPYLVTARIRQRKFKIVVDCINAAGGVIVPALLRELGCNVVGMNCDVNGVFAHAPEPVPENLSDLATRVRSERADLGIAVDPDVDRLVFIMENGEPYGEEYTIASAVKFVLQREATTHQNTASRGTHPAVVVNLSTTRAVEDIANAFGATFFRTPVGEINVARKMKEVGAVIGGEGSGGVILPALHLGRDALVGIALILQSLAESGGALSDLRASMPAYSIAKGKVEVRNISPAEVLQRVRATHQRTGRINTEDGVRIDFEDHWVHLRKSNTEPIMRIIAEAKSTPKAVELVEQFKREISALIK